MRPFTLVNGACGKTGTDLPSSGMSARVPLFAETAPQRPQVARERVRREVAWHLDKPLLEVPSPKARRSRRISSPAGGLQSDCRNDLIRVGSNPRRRRSSRDARAMCDQGVWRSYQTKFEIGIVELLARKKELATAPGTTNTRPLGGRCEVPEFGVPSKSRTSRFRAVKNNAGFFGSYRDEDEHAQTF